MDIFKQAFIRQFCPLLEPSGYKLLDTEHPVYVKTVGGEIMHVIMCTDTELGDSRKAQFMIWGGIATVYKRNMTEQTFSKTASWMRGMRFFAEKNPDCLFEDASFFDSIQAHTFLKNNADSLADSFGYACELTEELMLPALEKAETLQNCIDFFETYRLYRINPRKTEVVYNYRDNYDEENVFIRLRDMAFAKRQKALQKSLHPASDSYRNAEKLYTAVTDDAAYEQAVEEMNSLKEKNIAFLKKLGAAFCSDGCG